MSDSGTPDPDQPGEELDESSGWDEYPPDQPIGLDEVLGEEDEDDEDFDPAPDASDEDDDDEGDDELDELLDDEGSADDLLSDELEPEEPLEGTGEVAASPEEPGQLADDDEFTGDESARDYATEHVPTPAEDDALHVEPHRLDRPL
jgi:E3 ubiquitin-protein ligase HUWE1